VENTQDAPAVPFAVPIKEAQKLLGEKARSEVYEEIKKGALDAVKDGTKTLITMESIQRRQAALPRGLAKPLDKAIQAKREKRGQRKKSQPPGSASHRKTVGA